jgi:hypothetical protein
MIYIVAIGDIYGSWYVGLATTNKKIAWKDAVNFIAAFNSYYRDTSKHLRPGG